MKKFIALLITVIMLMGIMPLNAFAAQEIAIVQVGDIKAPVAGANPDYVATYGSGYNFTTEFDTYGTSYGVSWFDVTANDKKMTASDVFEAGHVYKVSVLVKASVGYSFRTINNYITAVSVKINGLSASVYIPTGLYASEYVGLTYTFEACDYSRISSVAVTDLSVPASGEKLDFIPAAKDDSYTVTMVSWRDVTANKSVPDGTVAVAGHTYEVEIWLRANGNYRFKVDGEGYPAVIAKIGSYNATVIETESDGLVVGIKDKYVVPDDIKTVTVAGIDAPVTGATADTTASCGSGYQIKKIVWVDTTGEYKDRIYDITKFEAERKYTVQVYLETIGNYRFATDYDGVTDVNATINGEKAILYSDYSTTTVVIGYEFTATAPNVIDKVFVNGIDAPEFGKTPDKEGTCGEGYEITGIIWVDSTGEYKDYIYDISEFEVGHKYTVQITLKVKDGYKFLTDGYYNEVVGEINMEPAIEYGTYSDTELTIGYEFPEIEAPAPTVLDTVYVNGIDVPESGKAPDKEATCGEGYEITEIIWVDTTDKYENWVYGIETFEAGRKYTVQISLVTEEGYKFLVVDGYNEAKAVINGKDAIAYGSHSETELTIGFEFETAPEVHKHIYTSVVTAPTCKDKGFTTYTCECGDSYVADYVDETDNHTPVVVPGKPATKTETGLTDGEKCSVCDKVLKAQTEIPKLADDAEEILIGDVNKDGKITAIDARAALRIGAQLDTPTDYQKIAADYDKNGKVNAIDARLILRKGAQLD